MICVTIGRGRHASLVAEWKAAAEAGAELVELRLDCLRREPDLKRVLKERFTPVLITIRKGADGGLWRGDEEKRQRILREAIVAGVDYVDLESDIAGSIPAAQRANGRVATIAVNSFLFKEPVFVGDLLSFYATIVKTGNTSITVYVEAYAQRMRLSHEIVKVTEAMVTYVATDEDRRPRQLPKLDAAS